MTKFGDGNIWKWLVANVLGRTMPTTENAQDGDVPVYRDGEIGWEAQGGEECLPLAGGSMDEDAYILLNDNAGQDTAITGGTVNTHLATTTESGTVNYNTFIYPRGVHTNAFIGNSETEQTTEPSKYSSLRPGNIHMQDNTFERAASFDIFLRKDCVTLDAPKGRVSLMGAAPVEDYDIASKKYVDDAVASAGGKWHTLWVWSGNVDSSEQAGVSLTYNESLIPTFTPAVGDRYRITYSSIQENSNNAAGAKVLEFVRAGSTVLAGTVAVTDVFNVNSSTFKQGLRVIDIGSDRITINTGYDMTGGTAGFNKACRILMIEVIPAAA